MARTTISAQYRANESEVYSCTVAIPTNYPDALDEARTTMVKPIHDMLADALVIVPRADGEEG